MVSAKLNKLKQTLRDNWGVFLFILAPFICIFLYLSMYEVDKKYNTLNHPTPTNIEQKLDINRPNAEALSKEIVYVEKPVYITKVVAENQEEALKKVQDSYDKQEFPPLAYENTDRTLIAPKSEYEVGVYKVNLYRNWEIGTGIGVHDKDFYIPLSIKRNYDRSHSVEAEIHYDPNETKIDGYELKYNIHF